MFNVLPVYHNISKCGVRENIILLIQVEFKHDTSKGEHCMQKYRLNHLKI